MYGFLNILFYSPLLLAIEVLFKTFYIFSRGIWNGLSMKTSKSVFSDKNYTLRRLCLAWPQGSASTL